MYVVVVVFLSFRAQNYAFLCEISKNIGIDWRNTDIFLFFCVNKMLFSKV